MQCNWLIESNAFVEQDAIKAEVEKQGMICKSASYRPFEPEHGYLSLFNENDCVVYYGSLGFAAQVRREAQWWVPGVYCNLPNFDCTKYYPYLGKYLLNERYMMMPYGELKRQKDFIYETLGIEDAVFIRPNSGNKVFTGQLLFKEKYEKTLDNLSYEPVKSEELCLISEPRNITKEWRFVVVNKKIVAGSLYREGENVRLETVENGKAWDLAAEVAQYYEPDKVWTLDVCETKNGSLYVLEIGCFSCAGMYACNLESVVREVSKAAVEEWQEYQP